MRARSERGEPTARAAKSGEQPLAFRAIVTRRGRHGKETVGTIREFTFPEILLIGRVPTFPSAQTYLPDPSNLPYAPNPADPPHSPAARRLPLPAIVDERGRWRNGMRARRDTSTSERKTHA